jgi:hypothetical protein
MDNIKLSLLKDFPFLNECLIEDQGIGLNVLSREYENLFASIRDHNLYPQKVSVSSLSEDDPNVSSQLKADSIPLGNCFVQNNNLGFHYLSSALQDVTDKSISLMRACFITSSDISTIRMYNYVPYNRKTIFAKHDASAVTGIDISYEPRTKYDKGVVSKPPIVPDAPEPGPDSVPNPPSVKDGTIVQILRGEPAFAFPSSNIEDTQIDFNPTIEFFKRINIKVNNEPIFSGNLIPFDLKLKVNPLKTFNYGTLIQLMGCILRDGARFPMDNYIYTDTGMKTADDTVSIKFDDSVKGALIPIKDIFDILTAAWFSKNGKDLFDFKQLNEWLSTKFTTEIRYAINKKYVITVYGDLHLSGVDKFPHKTIEPNGKF